MKRNTPLSPNLLAHKEWFTQRLKLACLNKFVVVGEEHLDHVSQDGRRHYSQERPHSSPDQLPPDFTVSPEGWRIVRIKDMTCNSKLGGGINSYSRRAV